MFSFYEGEPEPKPEPKPEPTKLPPTKPTFSDEQQAYINHLLAEDKRKLQTTNQELIQRLEGIQKNHTLTEQQKAELEEQIQNLRNQNLTKEEQQRLATEKLINTHKTEKAAIEQERDLWKTRHDNNLLEIEIIRSAEKHEAFNSDQIKAILLPLTKPVEALGEDQKPTGKFAGRVKFPGLDKDKKPITLDLSVDEAVKMMKEMTELYGNLFKSTAVPGTGSNNNGSGNKGFGDMDDMSVEDYQKNRPQIMKDPKLQRSTSER
jgi:hypothetical protein